MSKHFQRLMPVLLGTMAIACGQAARAATAPSAAGNDLELTEVLVTGSRVITNGNDSPTPVTVIAVDDLKDTHPTNLAEAINDLPVFGGSRSQYSNTGTSGAAGSPATSNNAGNVVNMRSLGLLRTLILYDGHRAPPSTPDGYVDIDTIPQMLLQRVDVVTGGASAVYGSDAISGVVNFVTDTKFKGVKINAQSGISTYSDDRTFEGGIAFGTDLFGGKGHLMGSYSNRHDAGLDSKQNRSWGRDVRTLQGDGTAAVPYFQVVGARQNNATYGGRINCPTGGNPATVAAGVYSAGCVGNLNPLIDQQFSSGGFLVPFVHGAKTGISLGQPFEIGGDGGFYNQQLRAALDMNQLYGRYDFDFDNGVHYYLSVADTLNHSVGTADYYSNTGLTISRDNAFLLPQYRTALTNAGVSTFALGKIFTSIPRAQLETYNRQVLIMTGLQGSFGHGYKWEANVTHSDGRFDVHMNDAINMGNFFAALDSVVNSSGVPVCRAAATNPLYANCVPLNPFGVGSESQAAINYILTKAAWVTKLGMDDVSGSITGAPFNSWAGPINTALSAEWRRLTYQTDSTALATDRANCTGITLNCNASTVLLNRAAVNNVAKVATTVKEAALEFEVPMLKDARFAKELDLNAAYRHAMYDRAGNANTWKIGMTWDVLDKLTVRATRSRDFRAPSLDENFRPLSVSFTAFPDYITGSGVATTNIRTENGGNPDLQPEVADTLTYGVVFRPTDNLSVAIDAFDIKVKNAIFLIQGNTPVYQQVCYASKGSSPYCQLIGRGLGIYDPTAAGATGAANAVNLWRQTFINLAEQDTQGADIELNYKTSLASHPLSLRLLSTYQPHLVYKQPGLANFDYGGVAFGTNGIQASPVWRVTGFVNYRATDSLSIGIMERWRSSLKMHADPTVVVSPSAGVKSVAFTNLNVAYEPKLQSSTKLQVFLNVSNLFNTEPPQAGFWGNPNPGQFGEFAQGDDVIGRYYTVGVKVKL